MEPLFQHLLSHCFLFVLLFAFHFLLFFDVTLYYYIDFKSSIIFCLSFGQIYLSLSFSSSFVSKLFCDEVFKTLVILSAILLPIKLRVAFTVFSIALFEAVLSASAAECLA